MAQVEALANHLDQDVEGFWDEILEVERSGDVEIWPDHPAGPAVMPSGLASDRLGLSLSSEGTRWLRPHEADLTSIEQPWEAAYNSPIVGEAALGGDPKEARIFDQFPGPDAIQGLEAMETIKKAERTLTDLIERWTDPESERLIVLDRGARRNISVIVSNIMIVRLRKSLESLHNTGSCQTTYCPATTWGEIRVKIIFVLNYCGCCV